MLAAFENYTVTPEDFTALRKFVLVRARWPAPSPVVC
jgi:hypothetical protein